MSLVLLTRPPKMIFPGCFSYYLKSSIKKLVGMKRGPDGVLLSLTRGLDLIGKKYSLNSYPKTEDVVNVLSNVEALKWAIKMKSEGKISKLIAGPNLVVIPTEENSILANEHIDIVLVPSMWIKDFYSSILPSITSKIEVWPAGVSVPKENNSERSIGLIFKKSIPDEIYSLAIQELEKKGVLYEIIQYGKYSQSDYFRRLERSKFMIYLQEVESQGIALQEAWVRNVPTLVWNKGYFVYPQGHRVEGNISAPFLTEATGRTFSNTEDLPQVLDGFLSDIDSFAPRKYVVENLSDEASANTYARIAGI